MDASKYLFRDSFSMFETCLIALVFSLDQPWYITFSAVMAICIIDQVLKSVFNVKG